MFNHIQVNYQCTNRPLQANKFLSVCKKASIIAWDLEVAVKYTSSELDYYKSVLVNSESTKEERINATAITNATALNHPEHCTVTHCSIATSESEGFVFILDNPQIRNLVFNYLISTKQTQILHNASYDFKHLYYYTGKFPSNYEDTQILAKTLLNHTNPTQAQVGLKQLAGQWYGDWGISSDNFSVEQMYEPHVLKYAATDSCATFKLWDYMNGQCEVIDNDIISESENVQPYQPIATSDSYNPHDQLPSPEPKTVTYLSRHFYQYTAKHLIKDTVQIMMNGLHIDLNKVANLQKVLDEQLVKVQEEVDSNPFVIKFMKQVYSTQINSYKQERKTKLRTADYYYKPFNHKDMLHRSYFMTLYAQQQNMELPEEEVSPGIAKYKVDLVKKLSATYPLLKRLLAGELSDSHPLVIRTANELAELKMSLYNKAFLDQIESPQLDYPQFNPNSSKQKQEIFEFLGVEPLAYSKDTGKPSWGRDQVEEILNITTDETLKHFCQQLIDQSYAAIVRNNFIEAFYKYTVNNRLYGEYRLLGAKSGRYTSNSPNMLNAPSTGSIFAKPIKECFTAPEGFVIATIDYSALEDRVIASLSRDTNKCNIFLQNLDGHCLNAYGYFRDEIAKHMTLTGDTVTDVHKFFELTEINKALKAIRQKSKPATFGLSYGSYPPKVSATLKIPLKEAEEIFNNYHTVLYPSITEYRENYVLPTTYEQGQIHLGLGFNLKSDDPDRDIRTLNNATVQFWSILSALTISKLHQAVEQANLQNDIIVTSTIYDSIYLEVRNDPTIIKWLNDTIVPIMTTDFMFDQIVPNTADLEIGSSWADLHLLQHNATIDDISTVLDTIHN